QNLNNVTVCLRFFTDLSRAYSLLSLATPISDNNFLIYKEVPDTLELYVSNNKAAFLGLDNKLNVWHSVCLTWDSESGIGQLWFDGTSSVRKFLSGSEISQPLVILGQEQDSYGGGFDSQQSFVGMMSDIYLWDYVLSPCEIQRYVDNLNFTPGNVLNWMALTCDITEGVLIEDKQKTCY
ncbi:hypothetical protein GOODEAATRI_030146, partial [Goodea atripinnis]